MNYLEAIIKKDGEEKLLIDGTEAYPGFRIDWYVHNAVTEYLNYFRGTNRDNTLSSLWFCASAQVNRRALDVAIEMVE